jgi:hypothetical protein
MPWAEVLLAVVATYVVVKAIQAIWDFIVWYREGRAFAEEQKRAQTLRRQQRAAGINMPALKERPAPDSSGPGSKPPIRETKPPKGGLGL